MKKNVLQLDSIRFDLIMPLCFPIRSILSTPMFSTMPFKVHTGCNMRRRPRLALRREVQMMRERRAGAQGFALVTFVWSKITVVKMIVNIIHLFMFKV